MTSTAILLAIIAGVVFISRKKASKQDKRWKCDRCGDIWIVNSPVPNNFKREQDGPHVCPSCGTYAYTNPINSPYKKN